LFGPQHLELSNSKKLQLQEDLFRTALKNASGWSLQDEAANCVSFFLQTEVLVLFEEPSLTRHRQF